VTVAVHGLGKDVERGTLSSIWKQAGIEELMGKRWHS